MLRLRLITGPLLIVGLLALMWADGAVDALIAARWSASSLDPPRGAMLLLLVATVILPLASVELAALLRGGGCRAPTGLLICAGALGLISGAIALSASFSTSDGSSRGLTSAIAATAVPFALLTVATLSIVWLAWGRRIDGIGSGVGAALLSFVALGLLPSFFIALRQEHGPWIVVGIILTAKSCDIGAYFTGRAIGRRRLIAWLSPGKTWEGLVGGVATAGFVGGSLAWWSAATADPIPIVAGVVGGISLGIAGQAGDLAESLLKRSADAKDSGRTLPGMGGILDVVDSLLPAGPVAILILAIFAR